MPFSGEPLELVCPKCGYRVTVDASFRDHFYCHVCGVLMKKER